MINLTVKVNNQTDEPVRITNGRPVISWDFNPTTVVVPDEYGIIESSSIIEQKSFQIRIGTSNDNLGKNTFVGNVKHTGIVLSTSRSWAYTGPVLERGMVYYGQVRVVDVDNDTSDWETFSFQFNRLPSIVDAKILPVHPSANDRLQISYIFLDADGDVESGTAIRWFDRGVHIRDCDQQVFVDSSFVKYGQIWTVQVTPSDGYEFGPSVVTDAVAIIADVPISSSVEIWPPYPNENDILKVNYTFSSDLEEGLTQDKSRIRWYINGEVDSNFNDQRFVRLDVEPGDIVRAEIQSFDGQRFGDVEASPNIIIQSSQFIVENIRIDGRAEPFNVLSLLPVITWNIKSPSGKIPQFVDIRLSTLPGAANILKTVITGSPVPTRFRVPADLLHPGSDYFISIAVSDVEGQFENYAISQFSMSGSRWVHSVSHNKGWTLEAVFNTNAGDFDDSNYQIIRIQDGVRFAEVRIYADRLGFLSQDLVFSNVSDFTKHRILTVVGQNNDVKIYLDRKLAIDATGLFTQSTNIKRLEFGAVSPGLITRWQSFFYSINGAFHPGIAQEFNDLQFIEFADFPLNNAVSLRGISEQNMNKKVFAINPNDETVGGSIYSIEPGEKFRFGTAARTLSPIHNTATSPSGQYKVFSHARGASIFKSYLIVDYDHLIDFTDSGDVDPVNNGWELVQNIGTNVATFGTGGLNINTLFGNI